MFITPEALASQWVRHEIDLSPVDLATKDAKAKGRIVAVVLQSQSHGLPHVCRKPWAQSGCWM